MCVSVCKNKLLTWITKFWDEWFLLKQTEGSICDVADDDLPACLLGDSDIKSELLSLAATGWTDENNVKVTWFL